MNALVSGYCTNRAREWVERGIDVSRVVGKSVFAVLNQISDRADFTGGNPGKPAHITSLIISPHGSFSAGNTKTSAAA